MWCDVMLHEILFLRQVLDLSYNGITVIRPADLLASLRHLNTLYIEGNLIRDMTDAGLVSTRVLAKLVVAGNQLNVPDAGLLSRLEYLEEVDFGDNPFECTCALSTFLDWTNTTTVTIVGIEDIARYTYTHNSRCSEESHHSSICDSNADNSSAAKYSSTFVKFSVMSSL